MQFTDGDICPGSSQRVSSDIYFICDPNKDDTPKLLSSKNDCQYLFNWRTSAACEKKSGVGTSGMGPGAIAAIVIFSLLGAYLLAGIAYNRFVRGEKGLEQIPHFSLCQAGYYTLVDKCVRCVGAGSSGAPSTLTRLTRRSPLADSRKVVDGCHPALSTTSSSWRRRNTQLHLVLSSLCVCLSFIGHRLLPPFSSLPSWV
jgi:hypothetical protein